MKIDFLKERAEIFFENGKEAIEKKRYFLAAFNFEQAAQLYLKYFLFLALKDFPKIHQIDFLLREIGKVYSREKEVENFLKENASVIGDLNQAYITSRYLPIEFTFYQVKEMERWVKKLIKFLKRCQRP